MLTPEIQRAQLLMEVERFDDAIQALRQHLLNDPDDALAHAQLAICLSRKEQFAAATEHAQRAVGMAPEQGFSHYALGSVLMRRGRLKEAHAAADEAIRNEPDDLHNYRLRAAIRMQQERWRDALQDVETGLQLDAEDSVCLTLRAQCLMRLGRRREAVHSVETALQRRPDDAHSHATHGWTLLESGDPDRAMHHFREALRLDPEMEYAREGIIEAMQARHLVYRLFLKYVFWMMRLSPQARWGVLMVGLFGSSFISNLAETQPALAPVLIPLYWAYIAFAITTWIAIPLFNLLLFTNRFGRLALSPDQKRGALLLGGGLLAVAGTVAAAAWKDDQVLWRAAFMAGLTLLPATSIFRCSAGWPRRVMIATTAGLALLAAVRIANLGHINGRFVTNPIGAAASILFMLGFLGSQFLANAMMAVRVRR
jgi:tetratricopeptide (TPR) repeat protein